MHAQAVTMRTKAMVLGLGLPAIVGGAQLPRVSEEFSHRPSLSRPTRPPCHYADEGCGNGGDYGVCATASLFQ